MVIFSTEGKYKARVLYDLTKFNSISKEIKEAIEKINIAYFMKTPWGDTSLSEEVAIYAEKFLSDLVGPFYLTSADNLVINSSVNWRSYRHFHSLIEVKEVFIYLDKVTDDDLTFFNFRCMHLESGRFFSSLAELVRTVSQKEEGEFPNGLNHDEVEAIKLLSDIGDYNLRLKFVDSNAYPIEKFRYAATFKGEDYSEGLFNEDATTNALKKALKSINKDIVFNIYCSEQFIGSLAIKKDSIKYNSGESIVVLSRFFTFDEVTYEQVESVMILLSRVFTTVYTRFV